jgi:prolyl-tRNA synthetase
VHLILVSGKHGKTKAVAEDLYHSLHDAKIEVLYDDRDDVSPGFKFKDADLLGMPLQVIAGEKNVVHGKVEIKERRSGEREIIDVGKVVKYIEKYLTA